MSEQYILSIDQGTSSTKSVLIDKQGRIAAKGSATIGETYPAPGWVDQDPEAIWQSVGLSAKACLAGRDPSCVAAVAFSTQRESMLLWDRKTGKPLSALVSWQDRRSVRECEKMRALGVADIIRQHSGLPLDPMFSALKAKWLLDTYDFNRSKAEKGEICLGTVDSFFLSRLAGNDHLTEAGNASRTQLLNVAKGEWDQELLRIFQIPQAALPRVVKSNGPFPAIRNIDGLKDGTPVMAVLGDSHSALFGHGAFGPGKVKATYGTGSSVMGIVDDSVSLHPGICLTIGWQLDAIALAAECNIRSSGATIRWAANLFGVEPADIAAMAERHFLAKGESAVVIPGFNGLGGPWWDNNASGLISGLTLDSRQEAIALGALESVPNQISDIVEILVDGGLKVESLCADGGMTKNTFLMQMQADLAGVPVACSQDAELSAPGTAHLAGLGLGWWDWKQLAALDRPHTLFNPLIHEKDRAYRRGRWKQALAKARS